MELPYDIQYLVNRTLLDAHKKELKEVNTAYYKFRKWVSVNQWYLSKFNRKNRMIFLYACENNVMHMLDWYKTQSISNLLKFYGICLASVEMPFKIELNSIVYTCKTCEWIVGAKDVNKVLEYLSVNESKTKVYHNVWEKIFKKMIKYDNDDKIKYVYDCINTFDWFNFCNKCLNYNINSKCFITLYKYCQKIRKNVLYYANDNFIIQLFNKFKGTEYFSKTEICMFFPGNWMLSRKRFIDKLFMEDKKMDVHAFVTSVDFNTNSLISMFKKKIEL